LLVVYAGIGDGVILGDVVHEDDSAHERDGLIGGRQRSGFLHPQSLPNDEYRHSGIGSMGAGTLLIEPI
jgi:hypothetical protein